MATYNDNLQMVLANEEEARALSASGAKIDRLLGYMLQGRPVTGRLMVSKFNIYSYRDAIYSIAQTWYVAHKDVVEKGIKHRVWWLAMFDEDFVLPREERC